MRILVISDIHGNADALQKVLEHASRWDKLWVLGDLVDYGPEPHIVVDLIRSMRPDIIVKGNHDHAVAFNVDCLCASEIHELSEYTRNNISYKLLTKEQIKWLRTLLLRNEITINNKSFYIVHGSPRNPLYGYLKPNLSPDEILLHLTPTSLAARPKPINKDFVVIGHTHIPCRISIGNTIVLNPGSVGQPRDGVPKASYMIIDTDNMVIEHYRVEYDINRVLRKLKDLNLGERYYQWLRKILLTASI